MIRSLICIAALWVAGAAHAEWRYWAGDQGATRYSPLAQINRSNAGKLKLAWTYHTGDKGDRGRTTIECTPIVIGGVMYVTSPMLKAMALDAVTGKETSRSDPLAATAERASD